ncbi:MAG TPA: hypothetical protein VHA80_12545 [Solirubrobacterales bacterium]|nr:hypothetical protein [Solirubrobacterales bacterium]
MDGQRGIRLRGYRRVFRIERRLYRFDRWRIPYPHGVPLRGIGYFLALELCVVVFSRLPVLGALVGVWGPLIAFLGLPGAGAFVLMQGRIDGRPPHQALASLIGWRLAPRDLAGLEPCPRRGAAIVPVAEITVAFDARESFGVPGRVRGPAQLTFRYPGEVRAEGAPPWVRDPGRRLERARRFRVRRRRGAAAMLRGKVISVPPGGEVVIE